MSPTAEPRLSRDRIEALFAKMARSRVVVVGDAMLDIYLAGEAERISPEAPVPVVTVQGRRHAIGGAADVATNMTAKACGAAGTRTARAPRDYFTSSASVATLPISRKRSPAIS